jgi:hypothetical protein
MCSSVGSGRSQQLQILRSLNSKAFYSGSAYFSCCANISMEANILPGANILPITKDFGGAKFLACAKFLPCAKFLACTEILACAEFLYMFFGAHIFEYFAAFLLSMHQQFDWRKCFEIFRLKLITVKMIMYCIS